MPRVTKPLPIKDANIISNNVVESTEPIYSTENPYELGELVRTEGVDEHRIWRSAHGVTDAYPSGNLGFNPLAELDLDNPVHWSLVDVTNKFKMFDSKLSSKTKNSDQINFVLGGLGMMNTVSLLGISGGASATVLVKKVDGTTLYNKTQVLTSTAGRTNWWAYFFRPLLNRRSINFNDIPPNANSIITVTVDGPDQEVGIGMVVVGNGVQFDEQSDPVTTTVDYGATTKNRDLSIREEIGSTGDYRFKKGPNTRDGVYTFFIPKSYYDLWNNTVEDIGPELVLFTATNLFDSTNIFGIFGKSDASIDHPTHCRVNAEIKGMF